jgi:hypothetical protein
MRKMAPLRLVIAVALQVGYGAMVFAVTPASRCRSALSAATLPSYATPAEYRSFQSATERAFQQCNGTSVPAELRAKAIHDWASLLRSRDAKGAETLLREAIDEIRSRHGADSPALLPLLDGLSSTLLQEHGGPTEEMLMLANERLRISRNAYGEQSEKAAESMLFIAYHFQLSGDVPAAEKYYRDGIAIAEKACASAKCWTLSLGYTMLGDMLASDAAREPEARELKLRGEEAAPMD